MTVEEVEYYFKWCGNIFDCTLGYEILMEDFPEIELSHDESAKFFRDYLKFLKTQNPHDYVYEYKRNLVFNTTSQ